MINLLFVSNHKEMISKLAIKKIEARIEKYICFKEHQKRMALKKFDVERRNKSL